MKFYRHYRQYFVISACFLIPGVISLLWHGFKPGIDFTGGSILTLRALEASQSGKLTETNLRDWLAESYQLASVKRGDAEQVIIRTAELSSDDRADLLATVTAHVPVEQVEFESVGATIGTELIEKTLAAVALASIVLVAYLHYRFHDLSYGLGALLGVVHDVTIICGIFSLLGWWRGVEVDSLFVTAMLTTISFSVHDTVVIYDRIRELRQKFPQATFAQLCEVAVTATISRSFNNSLTVVFMLLSLLLLGGATLCSFALALLLGVIFGTYSSPFTSIPLLLLFDDKGWFKKKKHDKS